MSFKPYIFIITLLSTVTLLGQQANTQEIKIGELIEGTLVLADQNPKNHLAIIIAGSGMTDRDGNQPMLKNNSLKKLAIALGQDGISSFCYDKRILKLVQKNALDEKSLRFDDLVNDALSIIEYFQKSGYGQITLIGHDQGALVATVAASKSTVNKLITLAGAGSPIDEVIVSKIKQEAPDLAPSAKKAFEEMRQKGKSTTYDPALESIFRKSIQPFMLSWMNYDPAEVLGTLNIPVLVVEGKKDMQSLPEDSKNLVQNAPQAIVVAVPKMNHVLTEIEGDDLENGKSYNEPQRPLSPYLITTLTGFIKK